jgi:hypothetical protein
MKSKFKWIFSIGFVDAICVRTRENCYRCSFRCFRTLTWRKIVKGTARGTQADLDGRYSVKAKTGDVLFFHPRDGK